MKNTRTTFKKLFFCLSIMPAVASAQDYQGGSDYQNALKDYITLYEDCNYEGARVALSVGAYENMGVVQFGNDKVSAIRVPEGFTVKIYEHDDYRGDAARILDDIRCFDKKWNDRVSSIIVDSDNRRRYQKKNDYDDDGWRLDRADRTRANTKKNSHITGRNVTRVVFGNRLLQQTGPTVWQMTGGRGAAVQFQEIRRDDNLVLLQNNAIAQRVRINLAENNVTFVNRGRSPEWFSISSVQDAAFATAPVATTPRVTRPSARPTNVPPRQPTPKTPVSSQPNRELRGPCFNYKAYTRGGEGGLRFHGDNAFNQFRTNPLTGRICGKGPITMEINKKSLSTDVLIEIQGRTFRFSPNEKEDVLRNTWYRKLVKLVVR